MDVKLASTGHSGKFPNIFSCFHQKYIHNLKVCSHSYRMKSKIEHTMNIHMANFTRCFVDYMAIVVVQRRRQEFQSMVSSPFLDIYCHKIHVVIGIGSQKPIEPTLTPPLEWMQLVNLHPQILREADFAPTEFLEKLILLFDFHTKAPFIFRVSFWSTYKNLHLPFQNPNMDLIGVDTRGERLNLNLLILRKADFILLFFIHKPFSSSLF